MVKIDYYSKYLKYKQKYLKQKNLQIGGNNKYINIAIRRIGIDKCLGYLDNFFNKLYPGIFRLSIGSGNGYFESLFSKNFNNEPQIICIDPNPLSYGAYELTKEFIEPSYATAEEFKQKNPDRETVLFINWPDPTVSYDIEAIRLLKPIAFFIIYAERVDDTGSLVEHRAGSNELQAFLIQGLNISLDDQLYFQHFSYQGRNSNLRISIYINKNKDTILGYNYLRKTTQTVRGDLLPITGKP